MKISNVDKPDLSLVNSCNHMIYTRHLVTFNSMSNENKTGLGYKTVQKNKGNPARYKIFRSGGRQ
jgi:hypothetical protein